MGTILDFFSRAQRPRGDGLAAALCLTAYILVPVGTIGTIFATNLHNGLRGTPAWLPQDVFATAIALGFPVLGILAALFAVRFRYWRWWALGVLIFHIYLLWVWGRMEYFFWR